MNPYAEWEARNAEYLGDALEWLRRRLEGLVPDAGIGQPVESAVGHLEDPVPADQGWSFLAMFRRPPSPPSAAPLRLPPSTAETTDRRSTEELRQRMEQAAESEHPPALPLLAHLLGLSAFERDVLLLAVAVELQTQISSLCGLAQGTPARPFPTFALAFTLFDDPAWEALSPERPLRYFQLVEINRSGATPLTAGALRADERIVNYVKGLNYLDDRLAHLVSPLPHTDAAGVPDSQRRVVQQVLQALAPPSGPTASSTIRVDGSDGASKRLVASVAAARLGLHMHRLSAELLPADAAELESLARLWQRESLLLPLALYIDGVESTASAASLANRFASRVNSLTFLDLPTDTVADAVAVTLEVRKPTPAEQRTVWNDALGQRAGNLPALLAGQFNLGADDIRDVSARVLGSDDATKPLGLSLLWRACLEKTRPMLDNLAERVDAKARWNDFVLPESELQLLRQISAQMAARVRVYDDWGFRARMNRGLGISALFAGDSGTGKTMAAEVLANALQLRLYRIDLSSVVSKYIGETEKNLRRVFDAAEDGGAILLFDEADALFGKRSEVKDSHDRYANIEVNYLLQRMEAFQGLAILATNLKSALDVAFVRRLRFVVNFPFPNVAQRRAIWERALPEGVPRRGLDFAHLARFNIAGGSIHNIALNAAFLAARAGTPVTMRCVLDAARMELRKMDRPINEADLEWPDSDGAAA